jgi:hypothetical protein
VVVEITRDTVDGWAFDPFRFVLISIAGWMNQQQQQASEYFARGNKVLR